MTDDTVNLLTAIIAGIAQGITEWLPVSSEAVLTLLFQHIGTASPETAIKQAIMFHLGSTAAAAIYFRQDLITLFNSLPSTLSSIKSNTLFWNLTIATVATGISGAPIYYFVLPAITASPSTLAIIMALALTATGLIRLYNSTPTKQTVSLQDSGIAGILQGTAIIPGISRSGTTVFGLLLRRINAKNAFKFSFLMSIPAVIGANAVILIEGFSITPPIISGIIASFITGITAINIVLTIADRSSIAPICFILAVISLFPAVI